MRDNIQSAAVGIIPANTGRMPRCSLVRQVGRDHPREYGENIGEPISSLM